MSDEANFDHRRAFDFITSEGGEESTVEEFIQKVFRQEPEDGGTAPSYEKKIEDLLLDESTHLIEQASQTMLVLASKCELLEMELRDSVERAFEHGLFVNSLRNVVAALKKKNSYLENSLSAMSMRCESAEAQVAALQEQKTVDASRISRAEISRDKIKYKLRSAFGSESSLSVVIKNNQTQRAAE